MTKEITLNLALPYQVNLRGLEKETLRYVMHAVKYNQSKAAKQMGISRGSLRMKLAKHFGNEYFRDS